MDWFRRLPLIVFVVLLPASVTGQGLTGTIIGIVHDSSGGVVPGAIIRLTSSALIGGERHTISSDRGEWRLLALPPGVYTLTVQFSRTLGPYRERAIDVGAGETVARDVTLTPAGVAESITVRPTSDLNPRTIGIETRFGRDFVRSVPTRRYSMFSLINNTPGVSPTSPTSGSVNTVSVFGSAVNENAFLIDGTNFTCPCQGVSRAEPIVDVIQELDVQSMGASVEFGNLQGGVFNVVTRQGGARFAGDASYYGQSSSLTAQPIVLPVANGAQPSSGYERIRYRDLTTTLGGPVKPERLWFFGAYQYLRDYDSQPGADPAFPRRYEQNKVFGKLNWQLSPSLHLMQSFHQEQWVNPTAPTRAAPFVTTQRVHASVPNMTFADVTQVPSSGITWEASVGRFLLRQDADPSSGDRATPSHIDQVTGISSDNASQITTLHLDRITAKAVLHRYRSGWVGADHDFKVGAQFERGEHRLLSIVPGGVRFIDDNTAPFQEILRAPSIVGGVFVTSALFASDTFTIKGRITADAGVRYDHARAINPDLPVVSADGHETDASMPGRGTVYTHDVASPRLGLTAALDGSAHTLLRASYGRFNQGILTGELDPISQGTTAITTMAYDAATGGYTRVVSVVDPKFNLALDPHTRAPHTDEYSVALDRQIAPGFKGSAAYVVKRGGDFVGWVDTGGEYSEQMQTVGGTRVPVFVLTNATSDRRFVLTNPRDLFVAYDGLVLALAKRQSAVWEASGSYTYSRARGRQATSNGAADDAQFSTIARPGFLTFGQDPNDLTNAAGRLPNDRPHVLRATTIVHLPWHGLLVAANLQSFSGKPWAASAQVTLPQGSRRILLEPLGTRRLSFQSLLDVRVSKTLTFGDSVKIDLLFDVLNLLDDTAAEALVSDNRSAATFGHPRAFVDPRRAMLGLRLNVGR